MSDDNTRTQTQDENLGTSRPMSDETAFGERGQRLGAGTADIMEHVEHGHTTADPFTPARGEHDPREVDLPDLQIPRLGPSIDNLVDAWAPAGSALDSLRDSLRWGIVNTLYSQTTEYRRQVEHASTELGELLEGGTPSAEVAQIALEEASDKAQRVYDRLGALERLHHAATVNYRQQTQESWRPHARRSYVGTQERFAGSYSTGGDVARANRQAAGQRQLEQDLADARAEQEARSRERALARARAEEPAPTPYEDGPYLPPPPVPQDAYDVMVVGDPDYPQRREVSNALERLRAKHPDLVVNGLAGTEMGDFAREWADLHGVPSRAIGGSLSLFERPNLSAEYGPTGETIPSARDPSVEIPTYELLPDLEHPTSRQIARRQGAIVELSPRVIMTFGEDRYQTRPFTELAHNHNFALWSFDERGQGTAYQGGKAPAPEERVRTRAPVYAGIGARQTPPHILELMRETAQYLAEDVYTLRSGGARGADQAFEDGADLAGGEKAIFIPEDGFRGRRTSQKGVSAEVPDLAFTIAAEHYSGNWAGLKDETKRLHARNSLQLLGSDLNQPADIVICWSRDGHERGGTGQAIRLARAYNIPVINLGAPGAPTTAADLAEKVRQTVLPWTPGQLDQAVDANREIAPPEPKPIPEYQADARADFSHSQTTLKHANAHLDRFLLTVGPDGTQLSDSRAGVAWGLVNVVDYQLNRAGQQLEKDLAPDERSRTIRQYRELTTLRNGLGRHYSASLRLGPWTRRGDRRTSLRSYAEAQGQAFLAKRAQGAVEQHQVANARVLVEGAQDLTFNEYDRLDRLLKNVRQWHLDNEGRDIAIVHKSPQSILRSWAENNGVHQHVYQPDFRRHANQAPARRDRDMVFQHPPDRYLEIQTPEAKNYTRRHVETYNERAHAQGKEPIRMSRAVPATALDPAKDGNVVALHPKVEPLRFNSKTSEGTVLSNFANTPIRVDGLEWASVEHYYQASKLGAVLTPQAEKAWEEIRTAPNGPRTKSLGGQLAAPTWNASDGRAELVPDWDTRRIGIMAEALCAKFEPGTDAAQYLLSTGNRPLIHETNWGRNGDTFWGAGTAGDGRNLLGHMLEQCRDHLRAGHAPVLEKLLEPQGIDIPDPAQARVGDYVSAHHRYEESYKAWTESYYSAEPGVAEARAAETAANGAALSRAASTFLANFDRYEAHFATEEFGRADLEKHDQMYQAHAEKTPQYQQQLGELAP